MTEMNRDGDRETQIDEDRWTEISRDGQRLADMNRDNRDGDRDEQR
jgi:hypothetical protein